MSKLYNIMPDVLVINTILQALIMWNYPAATDFCMVFTFILTVFAYLVVSLECKRLNKKIREQTK